MQKWIEQWDGFEWDEGNSSKNLLKHGISMEECEQAFFAEPLLIADDTTHSELEERQNALGMTQMESRYSYPLRFEIIGSAPFRFAK